MFSTDKKKKEEVGKAERSYLELLSGFVVAVKRDFKIFGEVDMHSIFLDINKGKYELLNFEKAQQNHAAVVSLFDGLDLLPRCTRVIDNAIGTTLANPKELDTLLKGLTNSLLLTEVNRLKIEESFRKFPVLIYARLIELTVVS